MSRQTDPYRAARVTGDSTLGTGPRHGASGDDTPGAADRAAAAGRPAAAARPGDGEPAGSARPEPRPAAAPDDRGILHERLRFLNDAAARIGSSLDLEQTLRELGGALAPEMADFVAVHAVDALFGQNLPEEDLPLADDIGAIPVRRVVVVHDDDSLAWSDRLQEGDVHVHSPDSPLYRAMASGRPYLLAAVDEAAARAQAAANPSGDIAPLLLGRSLLAVPLNVRDRVLGAVVLLRRPDRAPFDEADALVVRQLCAQGGLGAHNAYLYQAEAMVADALQRSMLPVLPSRIASVELATRYLSSSHLTRIGGDWFDAIQLPGNRVALVVGDVTGHGLRSAAAMGPFRTAVRTLAAMDLPPEQVLRQLDDLAQQLDDKHLATCVYAVYDPVARMCTVASAGHIPPVLLHADGRAELLDLPSGAPIGLGGVAFESVDLPVADGDVIVLCTDGLVENRGEDIGEGLDALRRSLTDPRRALDDICATVLDTMNADEREDDVALLVARLNGIPQGSVANWFLDPRQDTPARVRRLVRTTLKEWGLVELTDVTELLATELVTNAVRYASRPIEFRLMRTDALLCEVGDDDYHRPVLRDADDDDEGGRGLQLVSRLARRWGTSVTANGKIVWFEQALT